MVKPVINSFDAIAPLLIQEYERYLPTAFDESMTLVQKVNKVIQYGNDLGLLTNNILTQWNSVMEWVMNEGLTAAVIKKLDEMVLDGTLDEIINQNVFGKMQREIDDIYVNAVSKGIKGDGSDETILLQSLVDTYRKLIVPVDVKFSEITLKTDYQKVRFDGKVSIVNGGRGIIFGNTTLARNIELTLRDLIGDSVSLINGSLPSFTQNSGILFQNSNFCKVFFDRIEGFKTGIEWSANGNGTENRVSGSVVQLCDKAISINNNQGTSAHEGNTISCSIFASNIGLYIADKSKYQHVSGVVDCAMVNNSMDIIDKSSANIFHLYYVRGSKVQIDRESLLYVLSNDTGNEIQFGKLSLSSNGISGYKDNFMLSFGDPVTQNAYRFTPAIDGYEFKYIADGGQNHVPLKISKGGYLAFPKRLQGDYNGFVGFDMTTIIPNPLDGTKVVAIDTDTVKMREYNFLYGKWVWHELDIQPSYASNEVLVNTNSSVVVTHNLNVDYHQLIIDLSVIDAGKYRKTFNISYSINNNNSITIHNEEAVNLLVNYIIKKV